MGNAGSVRLLRIPAPGQHSASNTGTDDRLYAISVPRWSMWLSRREDLLDKLLLQNTGRAIGMGF
jgi:hypothetical protein